MISESEEECLPEEVLEAAQSAVAQLIPKKSSRQYEIAYNEFKGWCSLKKIEKVSEAVLLAYFEHKVNKIKPSTLWSVYSMLKSTLNVKENVDVRKFTKLMPYLKSKSIGYRPKKSKILTKDEIEKFLKETPDNRFLLEKVTLIIGVCGALRRDELLKITIDDIEDKDSVTIIRIPDSKTHTPRCFVISSSDHMKIYRKYCALRPAVTTSRRFFVKYIREKCVNQVVSVNKIRNAPKEIVSYLNLPHPETYTGHCFRRSSATLLADAGADLTTIKRHGGWRSGMVSETYVEDSIQNKISIANKLLPSSADLTEVATCHTRCAVNLNNYSIEHPELNATITYSIGSGINFTHYNIGTFNLQNEKGVLEHRSTLQLGDKKDSLCQLKILRKCQLLMTVFEK